MKSDLSIFDETYANDAIDENDAIFARLRLSDVGPALQGCLAHQKQPSSLRTTVGP